MLLDVGAEAVGERVPHYLLVVYRRDGDHLHAACMGRVNEVTQRVGAALGDGVRAVDDEHALRSAQFAQKRRERAAQSLLELDRQLVDMAQVDAQRLYAVGVRRVRTRKTQGKRALADTGFPAHDHRRRAGHRFGQSRRSSVAVEAQAAVAVDLLNLVAHRCKRPAMKMVESLPALLVAPRHRIEGVVRVTSQHREVHPRGLRRILGCKGDESITKPGRGREIGVSRDRDETVGDLRPIRVVGRLESRHRDREPG